MKSAVELFQAGSLREAIELATAAVKAKPMEIAGRSILAELLSFSGDLERADKQLEAALLSDDNLTDYEINRVRELNAVHEWE